MLHQIFRRSKSKLLLRSLLVDFLFSHLSRSNKYFLGEKISEILSISPSESYVQISDIEGIIITLRLLHIAGGHFVYPPWFSISMAMGSETNL